MSTVASWPLETLLLVTCDPFTFAHTPAAAYVSVTPMCLHVHVGVYVCVLSGAFTCTCVCVVPLSVSSVPFTNSGR